jgi:predicted RNase H-like HicB family nuclease
MLFKTMRVLFPQINYTPLDDGNWKADFRGFCEASATGATLEQCRWRMIEVLDERLAGLLGGAPDEQTDGPSVP